MNNYEFSAIRDIEHKEFKVIDKKDEEEDNISNLAIRDLKDVCLAHYSPESSLKPNLISEIVLCLQELPCVENDSLNEITDAPK